MSALPPKSRHHPTLAACPLGAKSAVSKRSTARAYSITSSANGEQRRASLILTGMVCRCDPWQSYLKFRPRARRTVKIEPTAQTVRHDVVEDMQAKACTAEMAARRVEWIEGVTPDVGAHAATIVGKQNFDAVLSGCPDLDGHGTFLAIRKSVHDRIDEEDRKQCPYDPG